MKYFRFPIPKTADGEYVEFSPGWHGTFDRCPTSVKVLGYDMKNGFGYAECPNQTLPAGITEVTEAEANYAISVMAGQAEAGERVFVEKTRLAAADIDKVPLFSLIENKWLPEAGDGMPVELDEMVHKPVPTTAKEVADRRYKFCPTCHRIVALIIEYEDGTVDVIQGGNAVLVGVRVANLILTCPSGHKVKITI